MKVLIVNHSNPFANGGGSFASHAYCRAFSEISDGNIDITVFEESKWPLDVNIKATQYLQVKKRTTLSRVLSLITGDIQRYTSFLRQHFEANKGGYDLIVLNGSLEGGALVDMCKEYGAKVITIHHNYDPEFAYDNISLPVYREIYTHHVYKLQKKAYQRSDLNLFLTKQDIELCEQKFGKTSARNELLGVFDFKDPIRPDFEKKQNEKITFVITGSLCTVQGVDGVKYFFEKLYKHLPKEAELIIAGRSPKDEIINLCSQYDNVKLIPNPENMNDVISSGDVYICPTRLGGGLKLRVLDGLRLGLPVITHSCSARGYDAFHGSEYFRSFNNENEFAKAVNDIVAQYNNNKIDKESVYNKFIEVFSYKSGIENLKEILQ